METPIIAGVIILILAIVIVSMMRRGGSGVTRHDVLPGGAVPQPATPPISEAQLAAVQADPQLRLHLGANRKLEGIKRIRELTNMGLKESKDLYEALERSGTGAALAVVSAAAPALPTELSDADLREVRAIFAAGNKIQAIKLVRERTGMGLKEAKDYVEALEA